MDRERQAERDDMVREQLLERGICDPRVLAAMRRVPRHRFVPPEIAERAYEDSALPIDCNQTISQPYIVAYMSEILMACAPRKVLEVGTGSGYQAAILANLCEEVFTIEWYAALSRSACERFRQLGFRNIKARIGDGRKGWIEEAPFDAILVAAGGAAIPDALLLQLGAGGVLVAPVGPKNEQTMVVARRHESGITWESTIGCRFVPLLDSQNRGPA